MQDLNHHTTFTLEELRQQQQAIIEKREERTAPTITPISPEYAAAIAPKADDFGTILQRATQITQRPQKAIIQTIEYNAAKSIAWKVMTNTLAQRQIRMQVDIHNRAVIQETIKYFIGDPSCQYNLQKGIFLTGKVGAGKTFLFEMMQLFTVAAKLQTRHFHIARCMDIANAVRDTNSQGKRGTDPTATFDKNDWCFDDIGHEPPTVKVFGDDRPIMEPILTRRYTAFTQGKCITHATSNLDPAELENLYGTRIADRFREMFNFILLDGDSRRA